MKRALAVVLAFALGCGVVAGAAAAYYLLPAPSGDLATTPSESTFPITLVDYFDQRSLPLVPSFADGVDLHTTAAGIVTSSTCAAGAVLASGKTAFTIEGEPLIALSADIPFYRDLRAGDHGADVDSLRRALAQLGYSVAASGEFGEDVYRALLDMQTASGTSLKDGRFHLSDFVWMPNGTTRIETCAVTVGSTYTPGAPLATTSKTLTSLTVTPATAAEIVPGARTLQVLGVAVEMPESGVLTDPAALTQITASPEAQGLLGREASESDSISGTSQLVAPLRVAPVPASSVFGIRGDQGCVASGDGAHPVTIVGANLGMSQITFDGAPPTSVLLQPEVDDCRAE